MNVNEYTVGRTNAELKENGNGCRNALQDIHFRIKLTQAILASQLILLTVINSREDGNGGIVIVQVYQ